VLAQVRPVPASRFGDAFSQEPSYTGLAPEDSAALGALAAVLAQVERRLADPRLARDRERAERDLQEAAGLHQYAAAVRAVVDGSDQRARQEFAAFYRATL
jgi:hypothetical protein